MLLIRVLRLLSISCSCPFRTLTAVISASTGWIWMKLTFLDSRRDFQQNDTKIVFLRPLEVPEKRPGAIGDFDGRYLGFYWMDLDKTYISGIVARFPTKWHQDHLSTPTRSARKTARLDSPIGFHSKNAAIWLAMTLTHPQELEQTFGTDMEHSCCWLVKIRNTFGTDLEHSGCPLDTGEGHQCRALGHSVQCISCSNHIWTAFYNTYSKYSP